MLTTIIIRLLNSFNTPVGSPICADFAGTVIFIQCLYQRSDRLCGIVSVEHVQINIIRFHLDESIIQICLHIEGCDSGTPW